MDYQKLFEVIDGCFFDAYGVRLNESGIRFFGKIAEDYGEDELVISVKIVCEQYEDEVTAFTKLKGVLNNRRNIRKTVFKEAEQCQ